MHFLEDAWSPLSPFVTLYTVAVAHNAGNVCIRVIVLVNLLTRDGLHDSVTTYCEVCQDCEVPFIRYQEYDEGVNNVDDSFFNFNWNA